MTTIHFQKGSLTFSKNGHDHNVSIIEGDLIIEDRSKELHVLGGSGPAHTAKYHEQIRQLRSGNFVPTSEAQLLPGATATLAYSVGERNEEIKLKIIGWQGSPTGLNNALGGTLLVTEML